MTLPIIPGPWNFLAGAGQAVGAYGEARNQRDLYRQQLAQHNAAMLSSLIARGLVAPEALGSQEAQSLWQAAGMPPIDPNQIEISKDVTQGRLYREEVAKIPKTDTTRRQLAAGVPTTAAGQVEQARGQQAQGLYDVLSKANRGQLEQLYGILPAEAIPFLRRLTTEKAITELRAQGPERMKSQAMEDVWTDVIGRLPKDPEFRRVADFAAINGVGYLQAQLEAYARTAGERDARFQLANSALNRVMGSVAGARKKYFDDLAKLEEEALKQAQLDKGEALTAVERTDVLNQVDADYKSRVHFPTIDEAYDEVGVDKDLVAKTISDALK